MRLFRTAWQPLEEDDDIFDWYRQEEAELISSPEEQNVRERSDAARLPARLVRQADSCSTVYTPTLLKSWRSMEEEEEEAFDCYGHEEEAHEPCWSQSDVARLVRQADPCKTVRTPALLKSWQSMEEEDETFDWYVHEEEAHQPCWSHSDGACTGVAPTANTRRRVNLSSTSAVLRPPWAALSSDVTIPEDSGRAVKFDIVPESWEDLAI